MLVFPIRLRQRSLDFFACGCHVPLLLCRPGGLNGRRLPGRLCCLFLPNLLSSLLSDSGMAAERFHPIFCCQAKPDFVGRSQQSRFARQRSSRSQSLRPGLRSTARQDFLRRLFGRKAIPSRQHVAHAVCPCPLAPSLSRNSATRLPVTAARYFAVDRISSIGWISAVAACFAITSREES